MFKTIDFVADHIVGNTRMLQADYLLSEHYGADVGYPDIPSVGTYKMRGAKVRFLADTDTGVVLEAAVDLTL